MFIKVGQRILNAAQIVEVKITPATDERVAFDEEEDREITLPARPLSVEVVTTAQTSVYDDGGDHPDFRHTESHPHAIELRGEEADLFLAALPVYEMVREET